MNGKLRQHGTGKMCCLGFEMLRRGFTPKEITEKAMPYDVASEPLKGLVRRDKELRRGVANTAVCGSLAAINDNPDVEARERETTIRRLFKKIGVRVKFIN